MAESCDVVIIGAGQAGLSLSHELLRSNREHLLVERGQVGQSWRSRWDSFCLVLPNWTVQLAGQAYSGPDPEGSWRATTSSTISRTTLRRSRLQCAKAL